ncbi:hypothetical protein B0H13DRAFT_1919315 [Mycena leptocephala]|nr:hypothetical protein B0H13DRAFT_1919315 [Mycena leptocephala]
MILNWVKYRVEEKHTLVHVAYGRKFKIASTMLTFFGGALGCWTGAGEWQKCVLRAQPVSRREIQHGLDGTETAAMGLTPAMLKATPRGLSQRHPGTKAIKKKTSPRMASQELKRHFVAVDRPRRVKQQSVRYTGRRCGAKEYTHHARNLSTVPEKMSGEGLSFPVAKLVQHRVQGYLKATHALVLSFESILIEYHRGAQGFAGFRARTLRGFRAFLTSKAYTHSWVARILAEFGTSTGLEEQPRRIEVAGMREDDGGRKNDSDAGPFERVLTGAPWLWNGVAGGRQSLMLIGELVFWEKGTKLRIVRERGSEKGELT